MARVIAADIKEWDRLEVDHKWLVVTDKPIEKDGKIFVTLEGEEEPIEFNRKDPVLVQWEVPSTTYAMRQGNLR